MRSSKWLLSLVMLLTCQLFLVRQVKAEESHCTSVAGMVKLLGLEAQLIDNLEEYAVELEKKLEIVRRSIASLRLENDRARGSTEEYLSNPLNSFSLIRRMNRDWLIWQLFMDDPVGLTQVEKVQELREHMPTHTDVEEAVTALDRIQNTYGLQVAHIAHGLLNGKQYNVSFTALDTYAMGQILFDQENYLAAAGWLYQTIVWMAAFKLAAPLELSKNEVRMVYAETLLKLNRKADALKVVNIALADRPDDIKLLLKKSEIETMIRTGTNNAPDVKVQGAGKPNAYQMGCRGQFPASTDGRLHCRYNGTTSPFLILAPFKMEVVGLDPYMVLYHDVLSAKEIEELQGMATPGLKRATVFQAASGRNEVVKTRTSKVAWFPDSFSPLTLRLNTRIADLTGFNLYGSEMLQLMNYGLGGHYDKHYDFFNQTSSNLTAMNGDRIATVLFYLTDVEQGGATVFPNIQKAIFPQRGSVIIWYNLRDDGQPDTKTLHAACPVIVGSKWVCNKWIREREQVFRRPCLKR
ncbi:LOW QUALITY PROTEIN: prolyl 4-hydroxylase subunit alpha-2 [Drosophila eugracilis]|uniref:LOW QUALITY PROTEIN: prolyl 4-hydroxylase subunit alpha-2 n=1 Tax=Drosophila eugracilis TaxID=29029 RepID=UPI001BD9E119|nr:LOW QUALITY PROTEIN: prolyl 4-hydroxylase subunit alpha-2 [Drosophila eugracilis]